MSGQQDGDTERVRGIVESWLRSQRGVTSFQGETFHCYRREGEEKHQAVVGLDTQRGLWVIFLEVTVFPNGQPLVQVTRESLKGEELLFWRVRPGQVLSRCIEGADGSTMRADATVLKLQGILLICKFTFDGKEHEEAFLRSTGVGLQPGTSWLEFRQNQLVRWLSNQLAKLGLRS